MSDLPIRIRRVRDTDLGFVVDTWRQSFCNDSYLFKFNRDLYFRLMGLHANACIRAGVVDVACDPSDEDTVLGWAARTGKTLHYVYVREALRRHGVARQLIGDGIELYSFSTGAFVKRCKPAERGWRFQPSIETAGNGKFSVEMG